MEIRTCSTSGNVPAGTVSEVRSITCNATLIRLYVDGVLVKEQATELNDLLGDSIYVGNPSQWNSNLRAQLDEFSIWNTALDQAAITALFAGPETLNPSAPREQQPRQ